MILTYKYRLKGKRIGRRLSAQARAVNFVWNYCVGIQKETQKRYRNGQKAPWLSRYSLQHLTKGTSEDLGLHAQTIGEVDGCFVQSRERRGKCPGFRKSSGSKRSLGWIPFTSQARQISPNSITYLGRTYKFFGADTLPLPSTAKGGHFVEDSRGRWYVCLQVEIQPDNNHGTKEIGVDLGLKTLVTTSDGEKYENPKHYYKLERKLQVAHRSHNYKRLRVLHAKVKNQRKDYLHKLSNNLVSESSLIIVGNVKNHNILKKTQKSSFDAGWGILRSMLRYKASRHGVKYLEVNEHFTTQTCSSCGLRPEGRPKGIAGLGIREWTCSSCGSTHDRDVNAAKNILILGRGAPPPDGESRGSLPLIDTSQQAQVGSPSQVFAQPTRTHPS